MNNEVERILSRQASRASAIARAVTEQHYRSAIRRVRSMVIDAGGTWGGLLALTAKAKARAMLNEVPNQAVVMYHATRAASDWSGPADTALPCATRRVTATIGRLLPDTVMLFTARFLIDLAGSHPEHLTPEAAENIKARL